MLYAFLNLTDAYPGARSSKAFMHLILSTVYIFYIMAYVGRDGVVFWGMGGLKEQVQQSVNFSEHANHETGHSRLRNIVTTWRLNEPSLPD